MGVANQKALDLGHVNAETLDPSGGIIGRLQALQSHVVIKKKEEAGMNDVRAAQNAEPPIFLKRAMLFMKNNLYVFFMKYR